MNPQKTAVIADTGCDIPKDIAEKLGIRMVPLHVMYPEAEYLDDVDIDPLMVYHRFPNEIPKTSMPSVEEITDIYRSLREEGYEKVIAVAISSQFSGSYNVMRLAAESYEGLEIFVFDTKNISCGSGIFAYWAAIKLSEGLSFEEVTSGMQKKINDSHLMFYMDTLTYLEKGGRIGRVASLLGNILKLKPIIACDKEGVYYVVGKARGKARVRDMLIDNITELSRGHHCWIAIMNGDCVDDAKEVESILDQKIADKEFIYHKQIAATMAVNTGPGLIGVLTFDPEL